MQSVPVPVTLIIPDPPFTLTVGADGDRVNAHGGSSRVSVSGRLPIPAFTVLELPWRIVMIPTRTMAGPTPPKVGLGLRTIGHGACCQ